MNLGRCRAAETLDGPGKDRRYWILGSWNFEPGQPGEENHREENAGDGLAGRLYLVSPKSGLAADSEHGLPAVFATAEGDVLGGQWDADHSTVNISLPPLSP